MNCLESNYQAAIFVPLDKILKAFYVEPLLID